MTIPRQVHFPGITPNPCTTEQTNRNWDNLRKFQNDVGEALDGGIVVLFELTAPLTAGGSAAARILDLPGLTAGDAITVSDDTTAEVWSGAIGYRGWARQKELDGTDYSIIWLERIAYLVRGTLSDTMSDGSAILTVTQYSDGADPGATVTVYDPNGHFPGSAAGSKAIALYNFTAGRYEAIQCDQSEWRATATADEDFDENYVDVAITDVRFKTHPLYTVNPTPPTTARNTFQLTGFKDDPLHIEQAYPDGFWEIITGKGGGGGRSQVHRFRLTAPLRVGGQAAAVRLTFNGAAYQPAGNIVVHDHPYGSTALGPGGTRGMWSGMQFMEGFARQREDGDYEIVWMETFGRFVYFTLTEDMGKTTAGQAAATPDYVFGQGDGLTTPTFQVHDDLDLYHFALAGAKGFAVRNEYLDTNNPQTPYYQVVVCQQPVLYGKAQLVREMCATDEEGEVTQFSGWTPSIFNQQLPVGQPTRAKNTYGSAGELGEKVFLVGDFTNLDDSGDPVWHILTAKHKKTDLIARIRWNEDEGCFEAIRVPDAAVMSCKPITNWEEITCAEECIPE